MLEGRASGREVVGAVGGSHHSAPEGGEEGRARNAANAAVASQGSMALGNIASASDAHKQTVVDAGGVSMVVEAMRLHAGNAGVTSSGRKALQTLVGPLVTSCGILTGFRCGFICGF